MIETTPNKQAAFYFWIHSAFRKDIEVSMDLILVGLVLVTFVFIMETIEIAGISLLIAVLGLLLKFGGIRTETRNEERIYKPFFEFKNK